MLPKNAANHKALPRVVSLNNSCSKAFMFQSDYQSGNQKPFRREVGSKRSVFRRAIQLSAAAVVVKIGVPSLASAGGPLAKQVLFYEHDRFCDFSSFSIMKVLLALERERST